MILHSCQNGCAYCEAVEEVRYQRAMQVLPQIPGVVTVADAGEDVMDLLYREGFFSETPAHWQGGH